MGKNGEKHRHAQRKASGRTGKHRDAHGSKGKYRGAVGCMIGTRDYHIYADHSGENVSPENYKQNLRWWL